MSSSPESIAATQALLDAVGQLPSPSVDDPERLAQFVTIVGPSAYQLPQAPEPMAHLVSFLLGDAMYSIPIDRVREVARVQSLVRVPQAPEHVRGVQPLRGRVLPVLEVKTRLGLKAAEITDASRILVVEGRGALLGLLVDSVDQVVRLPRSQIQAPPPEVCSQLSDYVIATVTIAGRLALLLDVDRLLSLPDPRKDRLQNP